MTFQEIRANVRAGRTPFDSGKPEPVFTFHSGQLRKNVQVVQVIQAKMDKLVMGPRARIQAAERRFSGPSLVGEKRKIARELRFSTVRDLETAAAL